MVDADVHHSIRDKSDLYPYLHTVYRDRYSRASIPSTGPYHGGGREIGELRADTLDDGDPAPATAKIDQVRSQLLDGFGINIAVLTGSTVYSASALSDIDYGSAVCSAFNDFTIEHWLSADNRFRYCMAINPQAPDQAAAEIDRIGNHPGISAVMLNTGAPRPYGQRFYRPIHEASARQGLPIALHYGNEGIGINGPPTAAGFPTYNIESRLARSHFYKAHLSNFVFEGVFETFPTLKVALLGGGFGWVPSYMWRMDADWKALRHLTPWVKRPPSEYVVENARFTTQPMEQPESDEDLTTLVRWMRGERTLMFSSDYPHWDFEHPAGAFPQLPADIRRRILADNARETFRL